MVSEDTHHGDEAGYAAADAEGLSGRHRSVDRPRASLNHNHIRRYGPRPGRDIGNVRDSEAIRIRRTKVPLGLPSGAGWAGR